MKAGTVPGTGGEGYNIVIEAYTIILLIFTHFVRVLMMESVTKQCERFR